MGYFDTVFDIYKRKNKQVQALISSFEIYKFDKKSGICNKEQINKNIILNKCFILVIIQKGKRNAIPKSV